MRFDFPLPPNRANARGGWQKRHFGQKRYHALLDDLQLVGKLPEPPRWKPFDKVMVTVTLRLHNRMDQGNALNRMKWIEDWLVTRGYITDDSQKHFEYTGLPKQIIDRKNQGVDMDLEIIIEDFAA